MATIYVTEITCATRSMAWGLFFNDWGLVVELHKEVVRVNVPVPVVVEGSCIAVWIYGVPIGSKEKQQVHDEGRPHDITYERSTKKVPRLRKGFTAFSKEKRKKVWYFGTDAPIFVTTNKQTNTHNHATLSNLFRSVSRQHRKGLRS